SGEWNDRYRKRRDVRRRYRGTAHGASARRISALYRYDAALLYLGRRLVGLCRPVLRARPQLCGLPVGTAFRRPDLQHRAQLPRTGRDHDRRVRHRRAAHSLDRHDLAGPYRLRPRARLRPEIRQRFRLHPSGTDREAVELGRELTDLDWSADVRFSAHSGLGSYIASCLQSAPEAVIRSTRRDANVRALIRVT